MRHVGWKHRRGSGLNSPELRARADKELGFVQAFCQRAGIKQFQRRVMLEDGSQIVAEMIAGQPRVTLVAPKSEGEKPPLDLILEPTFVGIQHAAFDTTVDGPSIPLIDDTVQVKYTTAVRIWHMDVPMVTTRRTVDIAMDPPGNRKYYLHRAHLVGNVVWAMVSITSDGPESGQWRHDGFELHRVELSGDVGALSDSTSLLPHMTDVSGTEWFGPYLGPPDWNNPDIWPMGDDVIMAGFFYGPFALTMFRISPSGEVLEHAQMPAYGGVVNFNQYRGCENVNLAIAGGIAMTVRYQVSFLGATCWIMDRDFGNPKHSTPDFTVGNFIPRAGCCMIGGGRVVGSTLGSLTVITNPNLPDMPITGHIPPYDLDADIVGNLFRYAYIGGVEDEERKIVFFNRDVGYMTIDEGNTAPIDVYDWSDPDAPVLESSTARWAVVPMEGYILHDVRPTYTYVSKEDEDA